jgi:hypothetical protein
MYSIVINDLIANFVALSAAPPLRRNLGTIFVIEEFKTNKRVKLWKRI